MRRKRGKMQGRKKEVEEMEEVKEVEETAAGK
jgi:hypothetical protein